jgi:serine/threonine protein kinase/tetratricopeptide (TPR) repeat protein
MPELVQVRGLGGRYEIEREVGRGGMGRVFEARDLKLDRQVAIKFLPPGVHGEEALQRFETEARAAGSLEHPNVLVVHDVGASEEGPYIVSELLRGGTLRERMGGKPLPVAKAVDYAIQLVQGLRAAHAKGVVHRDLKPENLFITHEGRLKILDFGIAKLIEREDATVGSTAEGAFLGTVAYMSPEQVRGLRAEPRSDLFAVGSILYEMLSGRRAFEGRSSTEVGYKIVNDHPPDLPAQVPRTLQRIVSRCLEKNPNDRYQSAADLVVDLSGVAAQPPRHLRLVALLGAAILITLAFPLVKRWVAHPAVEHKSIAVLPFVNLSPDKDNEYFSDGITEDLINALANVEGLRVISSTSSFAFKGKKASVADIGRQLNVSTLLEGSVRREGHSMRVVAQLIDVTNGFHLWSKTYDRELKSVLSVEDELAHSIAEALRPSLALGSAPLVRHGTTSTEAHDLYMRARYFWNDRTEPGLRKAIALYNRAIALDSGYALAYAGLADAYMLLRDYSQDDPAELLSMAKMYAERALQLDDTVAESHTSLALIAEARFDWKTADKEYRRAIELRPDYARAHHWYGLLLRSQGQFHESEEELRRALQLEPNSTPVLITSAVSPYFQRNYDLAIERLNPLRDLAEATPVVPILLATIFTQMGRYPEAVAIADKVIGPSDADSGWLGIRGYVHARAGDRKEALRILADLDERSRHQYVAPTNLALIHAGLGDKDRAFALLDTAVAVRDASLASLKVDPLWDALRPDARFTRLLSRMNFD